MKRTPTIILLSIILSISTNSCLYTCEFPEEFDGWIPYQIGDSLTYSTIDDTIVLQVIENYKTPTDEWRGVAMDVECSWEGYYSTDESNGYKLTERFNQLWDESDEWGMSAVFSEQDTMHYDIWCDGVCQYSSVKFWSIEDSIVNGITYSEVFRAERMSMQDGENIEWLLKAKDYGIVQFYDKKIDRVWTLINLK